MAAKPRTPAEREAGKGSFVAREKAEIRTRCRVCEEKRVIKILPTLLSAFFVLNECCECLLPQR